jgi:hypothetical protein
MDDPRRIGVKKINVMGIMEKEMQTLARGRLIVMIQTLGRWRTTGYKKNNVMAVSKQWKKECKPWASSKYPPIITNRRRMYPQRTSFQANVNPRW